MYTCACTCMCALTNTSIYTIILLKSVAVNKLQVAIFARSSREMSQTVRAQQAQPHTRARARAHTHMVCIYNYIQLYGIVIVSIV